MLIILEPKVWSQYSIFNFSPYKDITKTILFKYTENFTTKNANFQINILIFLMFLLKT